MGVIPRRLEQLLMTMIREAERFPFAAAQDH